MSASEGQHNGDEKGDGVHSDNFISFNLQCQCKRVALRTGFVGIFSTISIFYSHIFVFRLML